MIDGRAPPPVFVGELNPYGGNDRHALFPVPVGSSGHRLQSLICRLHRSTYIDLPRYNLCAGEKFAMKEARLRATTIPPRHPGSPIVLLGGKVRDAFNVDGPSLTIQRAHDLVFVLLPHPSGLCRTWNEPRAYERARELLVEVAPLVPWGQLRDVVSTAMTCTNCGREKAGNTCPDCGEDQGEYRRGAR